MITVRYVITRMFLKIILILQSGNVKNLCYKNFSHLLKAYLLKKLN